MKKLAKFLCLAVSMMLVLCLAQPAFASAANPAPVNGVQGSYNAGSTTDFTNGGTENIEEGAITSLTVYWNEGGNYSAGECNAGVVYKTVYRINNTIPTADGGSYRFSPNMFLGLSISDMAKAYAALDAAPGDVKAWN